MTGCGASNITLWQDSRAFKLSHLSDHQYCAGYSVLRASALLHKCRAKLLVHFLRKEYL